MIHKKICPTCGKSFIGKTFRHSFCCRKCFKKAYRLKKKEEFFPSYICLYCGKKIKLDFYPKKDKDKWKNFLCPYCNKKQVTNF